MSIDAATIGINGFGRIGRAVLRAALLNPLVKVTAINDPYISADYAAYLLQTDSNCSTAGLHVEAKGKDAIVVNGCYIEVSQKSDPASIPWKVNYVIDCSGVFTTQERASQHLASGASRVIIAALGADVPTFVVGVNLDKFKSDMQVISGGSPTGTVLAHALKRLTEVTSLEFVSFTAIHAATPQQKVNDGANLKDWAAARAASNVIPFATGAQKTIQKVFPQLAQTVIGSSYHVPTPRGCVLDLTIKTTAHIAKSDLEKAFELDSFARAGPVMVSGDAAQVIGGTSAALAVYDDKATQILGDRAAKISLWYDNEVSYARSLLALVAATSAIY